MNTIELGYQITIEIKNIYGKETIYPVCEKAKAFARIAGTKTLTRDTLKEISELGYYIELKQQKFAA